MREFLSYLCCWAMMLGFVTSTSASEELTLTLVSDSWVPFTGADDAGTPRWAQDIVHEALTRSDITARTVIVPTANFADSLASDDFQGSAAVWYSEERDQFLHYSAPYLENRLVVIGRSGSNTNATSFAELAGKRIGIVGGYEYGITGSNADNPVFIPGKDLQDNLEKLLREEVDYMLVDELVARHLIDHYAGQVAKHLAIGSNPLWTRSLHLAVRQDIPNAENIIEQFNRTILTMMSDGSYNRILGIRWLTIDIDGDGIMDNVLSDNRMEAEYSDNSYNVFTPANQNPERNNIKGRYYLGGDNFNDWGEVQRYKGEAGPQHQSTDQAGSQLFRFNF